jgi:glycosyltransferase involved in cell wall biosynthesis
MPAAVERLAIPADVDLVVSLSHAVAKSIVPPPGVPHVCYCFTPMRYAWDGRSDYFSASARTTAPLSAARNLLLDWMRDWDRATSSRVTHFVAISRTVAERIWANYGRTSRIVYPPVDTQFYTPGDSSRRDYYLCVSALVPYKRIDLAIEACNRLGRALVVVGDGPDRRRLEAIAGPSVRLTGWLSNEAIRDHCRQAKALLFPGNEDFGIVPVEAQACGTPVIAYGQGGVTETVLAAAADRAGSGIFFDRQDVANLAETMLEFESHPEWFDCKLARHQAEQFTAARFERELLAALDDAMRSAGQELCG